MSGYRPGQLYVGRDGDLLFVIIGEGGIELVTTRGTRLAMEHVERVYAPLELVRDVSAPPHVPPLAVRPGLVLCQHCACRIAREYGTWQHLDNGHEECNPDREPVEYAMPVDDPAVREFAADLVGCRVGVTTLRGAYVAGELVATANWVLTIRGTDTRSPRAMRDVQVEDIRTVELRAELAGGAR